MEGEEGVKSTDVCDLRWRKYPLLSYEALTEENFESDAKGIQAFQL